MVESADILNFWFAPGMAQKWYGKDQAFDALITKRFLKTFEMAKAGELDDWTLTPAGRMALIIVLDQFPRNMFRDTAASFSGDDKALALTKTGLAKNDDGSLPDMQKSFFYLPLMHSENIEDQDQSVALFEALGDENNLHYARLHRDIIARFCRFPHRNAILGRVSRMEEEPFLKTPNSSF